MLGVSAIRKYVNFVVQMILIGPMTQRNFDVKMLKSSAVTISIFCSRQVMSPDGAFILKFVKKQF